MTVAEWSTIANLATALGTLILAVATFSAVRSSNLMAKVAQQQLLIQLRPVLAPSRRGDPALKVNFGDMKWVQIPGGGAVGEVGAGDGTMGSNTSVVYLAIALRNAGNGIAVLQGWRFFPEAHRDTDHAPLEEFQRQTRDLYIQPLPGAAGGAPVPGPPGRPPGSGRGVQTGLARLREQALEPRSPGPDIAGPRRSAPL